MKKYMALYIADLGEIATMMKNSTPEESKKGMDMWDTWTEAHKDVIVDKGTPLGKTKTVSKDGTTDTKNGNVGYTIVSADSLDAAAKIFEGHPHFNFASIPSARIDIMECVDMASMK
jgi:hypothetical protein